MLWVKPLTGGTSAHRAKFGPALLKTSPLDVEQATDGWRLTLRLPRRGFLLLE
jgi:hypothetical protein